MTNETFTKKQITTQMIRRLTNKNISNNVSGLNRGPSFGARWGCPTVRGQKPLVL